MHYIFCNFMLWCGCVYHAIFGRLGMSKKILMKFVALINESQDYRNTLIDFTYMSLNVRSLPMIFGLVYEMGSAIDLQNFHNKL